MDCKKARSKSTPVDRRNGSVAVAQRFECDGLTREQRRSRRKRPVRSRTISVKRLTKLELEAGRILYPETDHWRPRSRADCVDGPRPCPYVACRYHLYIDVSWRSGAIKLNFPDLEVWELEESCALDVADRGSASLEDAGAIMNLTRERIRQVEVRALAKLQTHQDMMALRECVDEGPIGRRCLPKLQSDGMGQNGCRVPEQDCDRDPESSEGCD